MSEVHEIFLTNFSWNFPDKYFMKFSWQIFHEIFLTNMCCDSKFWPCCKCHFFCRGRPAEQGQALACFLHEIYLTNFSWNFPDKNKKILKFWGGHGPPGPPTNEATGTEQGQALPSSTEQGQALACFLHEIFLTNFSWNFPDKKKK